MSDYEGLAEIRTEVADLGNEILELRNEVRKGVRRIVAAILAHQTSATTDDMVSRYNWVLDELIKQNK